MVSQYYASTPRSSSILWGFIGDICCLDLVLTLNTIKLTGGPWDLRFTDLSSRLIYLKFNGLFHPLSPSEAAFFTVIDVL